MTDKRQVRLSQEWKQIQHNSLEHITAGPISKDNILEWEASIHGPKNTPYENGVFYLTLTFPEKYPFVPMNIKFKTPIYHPNINMNGDICLDIIKDNWSPIMGISKVLISICSLLSDPNPNDPLDKHIAKLYLENREKYNRMAANYTYTHAVGLKNNNIG
jgi:ubiquitin-conjugating enzyme E2 D/E